MYTKFRSKVRISTRDTAVSSSRCCKMYNTKDDVEDVAISSSSISVAVMTNTCPNHITDCHLEAQT